MLTIVQQIGVCILGWVLSILILAGILVKLDVDSESTGGVGCLSVLVWFAIFLIMPK